MDQTFFISYLLLSYELVGFVVLIIKNVSHIFRRCFLLESNKFILK